MADQQQLAPPDGLLHELIDYWADVDGDADFLIDGDRVISYANGQHEIRAMAARLQAAGIEPGDRICVLTRPCADFAISLFAAFSVGAIWVGLNPKYKRREIEYVLGDCNPKLVLLEDGLGDAGVKVTKSAADRKGIPSYWLAASAETGGLPANGAEPAPIELTPDSPAFIVYTSGTTGDPKGAVIPHRSPRKVGHAMHAELGVARPRALNNFPCNHVGGVSEMTISTFVPGGCVVFQQKFDPEQGFELIRMRRISLWMQVPTMYQIALDHESAADADLSSIEVIVFGGAAPSRDLIHRLRRICPYLCNTYGLTETVGGMTWTARDASDDDLILTVGFVPDAFRMRIADEDGNEMAVGEVGEIQYLGDYLFLEYWQRHDATRDTFTKDGWLKTGDLGCIDENSALRLTGRMKEMFKSGGYNVYPLEVEQCITKHFVGKRSSGRTDAR